MQHMKRSQLWSGPRPSRISLLVLAFGLAWLLPALALGAADDVDPLTPTWYNPKKPQAGKIYPLAVLLASKEFPVGQDDFWIRQLWEKKFCLLILQAREDGLFEKGKVRVDHVMTHAANPPKNVFADGKRLLLVGDTVTGPLAMRVLNGHPDRFAGAVFISTTPLERVRGGKDLWQPRAETWGVPMWSVVGTRAKDSGTVLQMWRKLAARSPRESNLTIDTRLGRGAGHLLPDKAIADWLANLAAGKTPQPGPDRQGEAEVEHYAAVTKALKTALGGNSNLGNKFPSGSIESKKEGPLAVSVLAPQGWLRFKAAERPYQPPPAKGKTPAAGSFQGPTNPFVQLYFKPQARGSLYAILSASEWRQSAPHLLDFCDRRLIGKGCFPVRLARWQAGDWSYQIASVLQMHGDKWQRWLAVFAAKAGSADAPATPLILLMDAAAKPNVETLARGMRTLQANIKVSWHGKHGTIKPAPEPLEKKDETPQPLVP